MRKPSLTRIKEELLAFQGNLKAAARALSMPAKELRAIVKARPELMISALEAEEQRLDIAEAEIRALMRDESPRKRLRAASAYLLLTEAGRKRWRRPYTPRRH